MYRKLNKKGYTVRYLYYGGTNVRLPVKRRHEFEKITLTDNELGQV